MTAWLSDGRVLQMPKFHANYLIPFHITDHSLLSHDLTNELTDVSGGDAWAPVYEAAPAGLFARDQPDRAGRLIAQRDGA